jgi:hypothetical protein
MQRRWGMWAGIALGSGLVAWGLSRARRLAQFDRGIGEAAGRLDEGREAEAAPSPEPEAPEAAAARSSDTASTGM